MNIYEFESDVKSKTLLKVLLQHLIYVSNEVSKRQNG